MAKRDTTPLLEPGESFPTDDDGLPLPLDRDDFELEDISETPSLDEKSFFPLYLLEERPNPNDFMQEALDDIEDAVERGVSPENLLIVVSDFGDADGRGCVAIYTHKYQDTDTEVIYVPAGHRDSAPDPLTALEKVYDVAPEGATVPFTDLSPNDDEAEEYADMLTKVAEKFNLQVRDHHPWSSSVVEQVQPVADSFVVESRSELPVCATQLVLREDHIDAPEHIKELAYVTAVRDLWIDDHPEFHGRGEDINDFAFNCDFGEYAEITAEYGADVRNHPDVGEMIQGVQNEKYSKVDRVADSARWFTFTPPEPILVSDILEYNHDEGAYSFKIEFDEELLTRLTDEFGMGSVLDALLEVNPEITHTVFLSELVDGLSGIVSSEDMLRVFLEGGVVQFDTEYTSDEIQNLVQDSAVWEYLLDDLRVVSDEITFAVCYGSSYPSATGAELQERGADLALMLKPLGGASFRASEDAPIAAHFATGLGGGGHDEAAGCSPDVVLRQDEFLYRVGNGASPVEDEITTRKANWMDFGREFRDIMVSRVSDIAGVELTRVSAPDA